MDILNRARKGVKSAGKGVVGVGKKAGFGVVGVGKGVGQGVGKVGKVAGQGVVDVGKGVGQGVTTVGKGVGQGVTTVGKGVGQGVTTVGKGVGHVGKAAGQGVVTAGSAVGKTAVDAASVSVNVAATAGMVGVSAAGAVGGTAVHLGKTAVDAGVSELKTISGRGHGPKRVPGVPHKKEIFCNDFYTQEFVLAEIEKARKDTNISKLYFEDLLLRESSELVDATTKLLLDTAASVADMMDDSSDGTMENSSRKIGDISQISCNGEKPKSCMFTKAKAGFSTTKDKKEKDKTRRAYEGVTFNECISSADDYRMYAEEKKSFRKDLLGHDALKANVPIQFRAKIELLTMLGGDDVKELLKEIEKDENITGVDFPGLSENPKKVPTLFMANFDAETGEWKEDAMSIEIQLRYGDQDNMGYCFEEEGALVEAQKLPRKLISRCIRRLEGSEDDLAGSNKDEPRKRSSKGGQKKKKGLPRKCVSEGEVPAVEPKKRSSKGAPRRCVTSEELAKGGQKKRSSNGKCATQEALPRGGRTKPSSKGAPRRCASAPRRGASVGLPSTNLSTEAHPAIDEAPVKRSSKGSSRPPKRSPKRVSSGGSGEEKPVIGLTRADNQPEKSECVAPQA